MILSCERAPPLPPPCPQSVDWPSKVKEAETNHVKQVPTSMFFAHNTALGPPYHVLIDTNFINFSIKVCCTTHVFNEKAHVPMDRLMFQCMYVGS